MNVRLSEGAVRFRISQGELPQLQEKGFLCSSVVLPGTTSETEFRYLVRLDKKLSDQKLELDFIDYTLSVRVSESAYRELCADASSPDGVQVRHRMPKNKSLLCAVQVDRTPDSHPQEKAST